MSTTKSIIEAKQGYLQMRQLRYLFGGTVWGLSGRRGGCL
jgi:hypothetical protein